MIKCEYCKLVGPGNWECDSPENHAQAELATDLPAFDEEAAIAQAQDHYKSEGVHDIHKATTLRWVFIDGARYQHAQDAAALSAMKRQLERYEHETETIKEMKSELEVLKLEKGLNYEGIEMHFESRIDFLRGEKFELKIEIEKLRADRAMMIEALEQVKNQAKDIKECSEHNCCSVYDSSDIISTSEDALEKLKGA